MKKNILFLLLLLLSSALSAQLRTFKTKELYYATCPSPPEEFYFTWDERTGRVTDFYWNHGGVIWFLHTLPSKVVRDEKTLYDYDVYLNVTTKGYESTAYQIRGKVCKTVVRREDGASFGGLYEGTNVVWMGANGWYEVKK